MAVFKCKMCGGSLEVTEGMTVCECEYCGTKQTIPKSHDDVLTNNFNRANNLRMKNEFDKAQELYEKIVSANPTEAEAYWGIVLCKYGIEYVEDPTTLKKIPTCHRTQYESVVSDVDYHSAIENADAGQKELFEKEAAEIDKLQKNILEIVHKEKPFDVFICYKETDENGKRTPDSVIANDIYYQLTQEGFKVFYAAITLEDKLGQEYEPYIFAALNSAKVMLVIGSNLEYFNAVWVKNEWSRYLKLMKNDRSKLLIPCYKDMDAYDLPEEFAHLQAQDMSKIGFINDVIRGMRKVLTKETAAPKAETKTVIKASSSNIENLIKRGNLALEDGKWDDAKGFFDQVLNEDVEEHRAYIGFLCAEYKISNEQQLKNINEDFTQSEYYLKACRFGGENVQNRLFGYFQQGRYDQASKLLNNANTVEDCTKAKEIFEWLGDFSDAPQKAAESIKKGKDIIYKNTESKLASAKSENLYNSAAKDYESLGDYLDSKEKAAKCREMAKTCRYNDAVTPLKTDSSKGTSKTIDDLKASITVFKGLGDFKDSKEQIKNCEDKISEIEDYLEKEKATQARARKKKKKITAIVSASVVAVVAIAIVFFTVIMPIIKEKALKAKREALPGIPKISAGSCNTVAIRSDGTVDAVGNNNSGQCNVTDWEDIISVSAGDRHTVGLKKDATVVAVGMNQDKQCDVSDWTDIAAVSAGFLHTVGLKTDGTVVSTGSFADGRCEVSDWKDIAEVSAGFTHTVGLKTDGTVVAVGRNTFGECDVSDWKNIATVSAGYYHTVGLKKDGTVVTVGANGFGQCDVSDWKDIVAVSAGFHHTVGLKDDGTVVAVGENKYGQCDTSDFKDIVAISAGKDHTMFLDKNGKLFAVGSNTEGQCNLTWNDISNVSAGDYHTVGLKNDGTVIAIGGNQNGQCDVSDWKEIVAVSARYQQTIGLKNDGTVVAVGLNQNGQCDVSDWKEIKAIAAGRNHTVGLKNDGTVVAVGSNDQGQCDVSDWKDITAVAAGDNHTVGLKKDGTVVTVGLNNDGQCNVANWKDIVAISAGTYNTVGLKKDGTVIAIGNNNFNQNNVSEWKNVIKVSAGDKHTVGLKSDGTVVAVGSNQDKQCDVSDWKDVTEIACGMNHTIGLKKDGTVVAVGNNYHKQCEIFNVDRVKTE